MSQSAIEDTDEDETERPRRCERCKQPGGLAYIFGGEIIEGEVSGYICAACGGDVMRFIKGRE